MISRYCFFLAILVISGAYAMRNEIESYISRMWMGNIFEYVYKACTTNVLFNILLTMTLIMSTYIIGKRELGGKGCLLRCFGYGFSIVYLFNTNHWVYAKAFVCGADYGTLLIVSLSILLTIDIISVVRGFLSDGDVQKYSVKDDKKGYCMDGVYVEHGDIGWEDYVKDLLSLMPKERLKNESLAIGISGCWGSGKTSFLNIMKKRMSTDYRNVSFNPWTCTNKEQIISQFFAQMSKEIVGEDDSLQNAIRRYRDLVLDVDIHPSLTFLAKILPFHKKEENIEALRNKIEKAISDEGGKSIAVFIDDLDRLEGDELFEVLRLIRITANFRNVAFVVAYDHDYVCSVLNESKNVKRADEYLHKIFHLEVSLPKFESETLLDIFVEEVKRLLVSDEGNTARLVSAVSRLKRTALQLFSSGGMSFVDFVPNFRQARRFANIFALNLKAALTHTQDIVAMDFLGIELIHFAYLGTYQILMRKPTTLLKKHPSDSHQMDLLIYTGSEDTPCALLLRKLFSSASVTKNTSKEIRAQVSYANYFCYRLPHNAISATEFEMTMIDDNLDDVRKKVKEWIRKNNSFGYVLRHFKGYHMGDYKDAKVIRNYICALLEFLPCLSEGNVRALMSDRYWIRWNVDADKMKKQIYPLFEYAMEKGQCLEKVNSLVLSLYYPFMEGGAPDEIPLSLLDEDQIKSLVEKALRKYIAQNGKPLPHEISDKNSTFNAFILSGVYCSCYYWNDDECLRVISNMMANELIRQYQGSEYDVMEFRKFIEPYLIKTDDPSEEEFESERIRSFINSIFDSYYNMEKFVHNTFSPDDEIEKTLNRIHVTSYSSMST